MAFKSEEYFELILRALRAKFAQNADARLALLETGDRKLVHNTGKPEKPDTCLPADRFVAMLETIRQELREVDSSPIANR